MTKFRVVPDILKHSAVKYPNKTAIIHGKQEISFSELYERVIACAWFIKNKKIQQGSRIAVLLDKSLEQVVSLLAVMASGNIFVLINTGLHENQVKHIINDCTVSLLITSHKFDRMISSFNDLKCCYTEDIPGSTEIDTLETPLISDDIATIIYTSGSTDLPKGIVITHRNLLDGAASVSQYLNLTENDRILGMLPFNFDYGLNQLISSLYVGCTLVLYQFIMPNGLLKILEEESITGLPAIPPIWASIFNPKLCKLPNSDFPKLRYITNTGGKLPVSIVKRIREFFPNTQLFLMYGLTEAFRSTYLDPKEVDKRPGSIGKAIPNVQVEVINNEGQVCKPGETGELIHRGACIARGYWNNPSKTASVYKPNPLLPEKSRFLETVVYSGDLVYKDEDGFLYFVGRKDNMIKTSGFRVSPTEVEELLLSHPAVTDAVVFGLPDENIGYKIRAIVSTSLPIEKADLISHCKSNAPNYLVPQEIFFKDSFPKTASGKLDRPKIIEESKHEHGI